MRDNSIQNMESKSHLWGLIPGPHKPTEPAPCKATAPEPSRTIPRAREQAGILVSGSEELLTEPSPVPASVKSPYEEEVKHLHELKMFSCAVCGCGAAAHPLCHPPHHGNVLSWLDHSYLCSQSPGLSHSRTEQPFFAKIHFLNTYSYRMCPTPQAP